MLSSASPLGPIVVPSSFELLATEGLSALYAIKTPTETYLSGAVQLLDLHGSRHDQGYAFGALGGKAAKANYEALIGSLIDIKTATGKLEQAALELVVDWQWSAALSKQLPQRFADEIAGFAQGCAKAMPFEKKFCDAGIGRVQVLANLPGDLEDVIYVLVDELPTSVIRQAEVALGGESIYAFLRRLSWPLAQCSMWAAYGSRTEGGRVLSGRNLDWNHNTGIDAYKLVSVFHPPEPGLHAHATFGYGGLFGALAGMSAAGLTTHEANLESNKDSFRGFPWLLRLRYVMEESATLAEAKAAWLRTNNTVGFNHMVASAADQSAWVVETNSLTSAFFAANDPREATAAFPGPSGKTIRGAPMEDAVWRTNHGFEQAIVSHYMWNTTHAYNDSDHRYHLIADTIARLGAERHLLNTSDAVQLTALVGQKGPDYTRCEAPFQGGSNVLSVAFDPAARTAYAAWEDGAGVGSERGNWRPAACNAYLVLDFTTWFNATA